MNRDFLLLTLVLSGAARASGNPGVAPSASAPSLQYVPVASLQTDHAYFAFKPIHACAWNEIPPAAAMKPGESSRVVCTGRVILPGERLEIVRRESGKWPDDYSYVEFKCDDPHFCWFPGKSLQFGFFDSSHFDRALIVSPDARVYAEPKENPSAKKPGFKGETPELVFVDARSDGFCHVFSDNFDEKLGTWIKCSDLSFEPAAIEAGLSAELYRIMKMYEGHSGSSFLFPFTDPMPVLTMENGQTKQWNKPGPFVSLEMLLEYIAKLDPGSYRLLKPFWDREKALLQEKVAQEKAGSAEWQAEDKAKRDERRAALEERIKAMAPDREASFKEMNAAEQAQARKRYAQLDSDLREWLEESFQFEEAAACVPHWGKIEKVDGTEGIPAKAGVR